MKIYRPCVSFYWEDRLEFPTVLGQFSVYHFPSSFSRVTGGTSPVKTKCLQTVPNVPWGPKSPKGCEMLLYNVLESPL